MLDFKNIQIDFDNLEESCNESEFTSASVDIANELFYNMILLSGMRESGENFSRKEAIVFALLVRSAKLFNSFIKLIVENDDVGATFLYRGIGDSIIDMEYLIKKNDDTLFTDFVRLSLYAEIEKISTIEERIKDRGNALPIEQRILSGIERDINCSGYTVEELRELPPKKTNKWKQIQSKQKIDELGYKNRYLFFQNNGNNYIHHNWSILLNQHLEYQNGSYIPQYKYSPVKPQMVLAIQQIICNGIQSYISFMFISEELKNFLSDVFQQTLTKIAQIDELHEAFLINRQNTKGKI